MELLMNHVIDVKIVLAINNGTFLDMVEIDAASNRGIDEIRQLKEKINYQL